MARGNDPGKDFDRQWEESSRRGREKASRGEGPWAEDKYLERINAKPRPAHHAGDPKGCADKTVLLLALLGGVLWVADQLVSGGWLS